MRSTTWLRAGTIGVIGIGLFTGLQASANPGVLQESPPETWSQSTLQETAGDTATAAAHAASQRHAPTSTAASAAQITPWQTLTVEPGDSLSRLFARAGLAAREWVAVLDLGDTVAPLKQLHPGDTVEIRKTPTGRLSNLRYRLSPVDTLAINRSNRGLGADIVHLKSRTRRLAARGTVGQSLSQSLSAANVPAKIATELANIYYYRSDLSRHMQPGDRFSVIYEAQFAGDQRMSVGPVIAASISVNGKNLKAFRATRANGEPGYYDARGHPYKPSISRHPVAYTHISSGFDPNRMHPILHIRRPHNGVDMAAARGTPIHAAADGTVKFVGRQRGYGRLVELDHFDGYSTRYGHMYRFAQNLHDGEHVKRGEIIGYVGATGEATGPHLHFEIRKDGTPYNPITMTLPDGQPLQNKRLAVFSNRIQPLIAKLDDAPSMPNTLIASNARLGMHSNCSNASTVSATLALAPGNTSKYHRLADLFCVVSEGAGA